MRAVFQVLWLFLWHSEVELLNNCVAKTCAATISSVCCGREHRLYASSFLSAVPRSRAMLYHTEERRTGGEEKSSIAPEDYRTFGLLGYLTVDLKR